MRTPVERRFADEWVARQQGQIASVQAILQAFPFVALVMMNNPTSIRVAETRTTIAFMTFGVGIFFLIGLAAVITRVPRLQAACRVTTVAGAIGLCAMFARYTDLSVRRAADVVAAFPHLPDYFPRLPAKVLGEALSEANLTGVATLALCVSTLFLAQVSRRMLAGIAAVLALCLLYAFKSQPERLYSYLFTLPILAGATAGGLARVSNLRRMAYIELERRMIAEREAVLEYEKDLEVARRIHDSILPPPLQRFQNEIAVHSYRESHATIGGDWLGIHETPAKELVVADVAGKGVHAALIAHSIQSVWTLATSSGAFEPVAFMTQVSSTLSVLGQRRVQSATMGVLVVKDGIATYWSAAHCAMQLIVYDETGKTVARSLSPQGEALGFGSDLALTSESFRLPADRRASLLIGTDGVFAALPKGGEAVVTLLEHLRRHGIQVVKQLRANDDKTLIWLEYDPSLRDSA